MGGSIMGGQGTISISPVTAQGHGTSLNWWEQSAPYTASRIYRCILTGAEDGREDVILPVSSFQYRLYLDGRAYLSCIIPNVTDYAQPVADRANGTLIVQQGLRYYDGTRQYTEMARTKLSSIRWDQGGRNSSISLAGSDQIDFSFDPEVEKVVQHVTGDFLQADGKRKIRTETIFGLFAGDVMKYDGQYYLIDFMSVAVGKNINQMEITFSSGNVGTLYVIKTNTNQEIAGW